MQLLVAGCCADDNVSSRLDGEVVAVLHLVAGHGPHLLKTKVSELENKSRRMSCLS